MTMVEKIAREIEPLSWAALGAGDTLAHKERRTSSLRKAKRILEGPLMEPTEAMIDAFVRDGHGKTIGDVALAGWRAMITKALSEAEEVGK